MYDIIFYQANFVSNDFALLLSCLSFNAFYTPEFFGIFNMI